MAASAESVAAKMSAKASCMAALHQYQRENGSGVAAINGGGVSMAGVSSASWRKQSGEMAGNINGEMAASAAAAGGIRQRRHQHQRNGGEAAINGNRRIRRRKKAMKMYQRMKAAI
jgi:hypothetical protein